MINKYKYNEQKNALDKRISAHSNFSNFNLHNWISSKFDIKIGDNIYDIGCGNGNYTELFFSKITESGLVYGVDKNKDLISDANNKYRNLSKNIHFKAEDYDLVDSTNISFDWVFSIYSLYYTSNSQALVSKFKKILNNNGRFVVIGPASGNALDLDNFHFKVTGTLPNAEHRLRNKRIEDEFYLLFKDVFGEDNVVLELINTKMTFLMVEDYAEYYWSTLLWRECVEGLDVDQVLKLKDKTIDALSHYGELSIEKQMSCLVGENK